MDSRGADRSAREQAPVRERFDDPELDNTLSLALAAAQVGTWSYDEAQRESWDATTKSLFGMPAGQEPNTELFLACVHPEDRKHYAQAFAAAIDPKGSGRYSCDFRIRRGDTGVERWLSSRGQSQFAAGKFVRMIGVVQDVTDEKRAEEQLRISEERFRELADNVSQFVWMADGTGSVFWYNKRWFDYTGTALSDMEGSGWTKVHHPDHVDRVVQRFSKAMREGTPWEDTFPLRGTNGTYRWFLSRALPIRDRSGTVIRWFGTNTDVTEWRETSHALATSEQRFRGLFENAATGIALIDLQGRFQQCNPAYLAMLGYDEQELRDIHVSEIIHPDDRAAALEKTEQLLRGDIASFDLTGRYLCKDGGVRWMQRLVSLLRNADGKPVNIMTLATDMTDRVMYEHKIELLLREVNHRAKNMLGVVQAIARSSAAPNTEEFQTRFADRVRALANAHDMQVASDWQGVELADLVRTQLGQFAGAVTERIAVSGPPLRISGAAAQTLGMALHELAANAFKYGALANADGRVTVGWETDGRHFAMHWREDGGLPPAPAGRSGFGKIVLGRMSKMALSGEAELTFAAEGARWELRCPLDKIEAKPFELK